MIETLTPKTESLSIIQEVRKWKEDHAAQYDFDVRAIGKALQAAQKDHPERIVTRTNKEVEHDGADQPAPAVDSKAEGARGAEN